MIGANVRTDTHPDAREFKASIKTRGVVEVITAYRADDGSLVVLRGQRRAVVAAEVGTPTGTVPVRVVPAPADPDRISDQITENVHRAAMAEQELRDGIEQLALCGVSAAQIAKRTALKRSTVNAAITVIGSETAKARMDTDGLTLEQAAIFAEFEHDQRAIERLTQAVAWNHPLEHVAQRLRDAAAETAQLAAEAARLRDQGLPALDPTDLPPDWRSLRLDQLINADGSTVPEDGLAEHQWRGRCGRHRMALPANPRARRRCRLRQHRPCRSGAGADSGVDLHRPRSRRVYTPATPTTQPTPPQPAEGKPLMRRSGKRSGWSGGG